MNRLGSTVLRANRPVSKRLFRETARKFYSTGTASSYSNAWKYVTVSGLVSAIAIGYNMRQPSVALETEVVEAAEIPEISPVVTETPVVPKGKQSSESDSTGETVPTQQSSETEADHDQAGAYNPETGEINWDCPCLGGMADGPCGEEFKAAFSCFIYSEAEPKGIDCIEKFKGMQECFRKYPEVYSEELRNDEEYGEVPADTAAEVEAENKLVEQIKEAHETEGSVSIQAEHPNEAAQETPEIK
ncbi:Oxidoreductase [Komagataella phaffii CBS 7435]|uniref:Mitochondrial intermembrane space import and assembly protein 40 n=2 Tax=Komagataella phaffii TaxID=460519 RepID=C4R1E2_KOMPG|nr:Essential protein of the mitochondrial intermembrane space (IMS) [Komagataella phaffii GS115]AOA62817.1 GQ67_00734T0 [Komagataella phaffii]CAH2448155.1 Oxidoreductase [Komagataella phaffii CBS 7435]AOA67642.1 GQ68_00655T0 [Komagataella phaffii GS115]CAY69316.1 Essential protein of the mitochondrial intermembrane space (IMS) [Komagataella phaffii GS115]SCV12038.1 Oxidoreductase [Komagataella phaffii CBS 7435]